MRRWLVLVLLVACSVDEEQISTVPPGLVDCSVGRLVCAPEGTCSCAGYARPGDAGDAS
jgi:hypothetical protein